MIDKLTFRLMFVMPVIAFGVVLEAIAAVTTWLAYRIHQWSNRVIPWDTLP